MNASAKIARAAFAILLFHAFVFSAPRSADIAQQSRKFDEFEDLRTSDLKAHFDIYVDELNKEPNSSAFIVCYPVEGILPGTFQRYIEGYREYLVNMRGVAPQRVHLVQGEIREKGWTELWIVPPGAKLPRVDQQSPLEIKGPYQFDSQTFGNGCVSEYTLELQEPEDLVRFFARALQQYSPTRGFIVIHPSTRESRSSALNLARFGRESLIKKHRIQPDRIVTRLASPRGCMELNLWLVPQSFSLARGTDLEQLVRDSLIKEAQRNRYTVRRVEFAGNAWTRDRVLRGRIPGLQEGEIFTRGVLKRNLASLSRLKVIKRVDLDDLDVHLIRRDKMIDLTIYVQERRRVD